jgi:hypothetical protein
MRWLDLFCSWLDRTSLSQSIQTTAWVVPTVQTIHILSVAVMATSALMIDLRLLGSFAADQPLKRASARFLPVVWWPLLILLATGAIMIIGEPARSLKSPIFQLKMSLILAAVAVTGIQQQRLKHDVMWGDLATGNRSAAWLLASVSILLWAAVIFAGRWIAYW